MRRRRRRRWHHPILLKCDNGMPWRKAAFSMIYKIVEMRQVFILKQA